MTGLHIRVARDSDREAIPEVTLAAYQEYAASIPAHWEGYRQNILATLADVRPAEQLVAEQDDIIVGTVLLYPPGTAFAADTDADPAPSWPEIRLLAVAPAARGRGVGAALVRECLQRARQAGAAAVTLHTTDMMRVAQSMYQRMGFERAPDLDFQPAPGLTIKGYRFQFGED